MSNLWRVRNRYLQRLARMAREQRAHARKLGIKPLDLGERVQRAEYLARAVAYDNAAEMARSCFREEDEAIPAPSKGTARS